MKKTGDCPEPGDKKRILIVEDYDDALMMLEVALKQETDYEVVACRTGTEALRAFLESFRCCQSVGILVDLVLPDINGLRVLSAIREIEKGSSKECVPMRFGLVSGNTEVVENTDLFMKLGIGLAVRKPYDLKLMVAAVHDWLAAPPPQLYSVATASVSCRNYVPAVRDEIEVVPPPIRVHNGK